ncbi:hypothetical protein NEMIN01_0386 [Nematocida minor]|uniref:uncharacterized protein n=1 Tax=Nematocida minor TaxID=1912983 RepID=UPI0022205178|nr:uncharacterized protein NEMIN01_0386 [Nematocida minor]KAI5189220.1 hypothetical protein NEMIN01_0386 [Nematocida minor]
MAEDYRTFLLGVGTGVLTIVFLQISAVLFGLRKVVYRKKYADTYHKDVFDDPPSELVSLLSIATKECADLAWLNISLQRFFYELTKSSTFYEKVKTTMVKKLSIAFSSGILKRIRFKDVSFGSEAPYIKSIRVLSKTEIDRILSNKNKEGEEETSKPGYFKQVYLLIKIDYTAKDNCIYIDADLIKGYSIPIMVKLLPFKGDLLLRMPANNYSTRFEISFIKNPGFDFSVDAAFSKNDSVFFSNSLSHIIKRICKYVAKMYVFPNWYYYYLPMVVSRSKVIQYSYYPVVEESIDGPMQQVREIQNLFSLDYSITSKKGNIIYRKTKSTVNMSNIPMERAEIEIPINKIGIIDELFNHASDLDIFSDVISDYKKTKIIQKYGPGVDKVHIIIGNSVYEFIRIIVDDLIIFQLANPEEPQFIAIRREPYHITIIQYVNTSEPFYLGKFRITKLAKKLEKQEMTFLGSTKLFKFLDYSVKQAERTTKIFKNKSKNKNPPTNPNKNIVKDKHKEKYISDGYPSNMEEVTSEVSIIESHFKTIETKLQNTHQSDHYRIDLPYTSEELKEALDDSLVRSAVLGCFTIMEDILLTDSIRNTSMAQSPSGQYVQLLSYSSRESDLIIERILLSEEYQGVTAAIKIFAGYLEIFLFGSEVSKVSFSVFTKLITASVKSRELISLPAVEIPRAHSSTLHKTEGIVLASDTPVLCSVTIEVDAEILFNEEVCLKDPFIFSLGNGNSRPLKINIKAKKKSKLSIRQIPQKEIKDETIKIHAIKTKKTEKRDDASSDSGVSSDERTDSNSMDDSSGSNESDGNMSSRSMATSTRSIDTVHSNETGSMHNSNELYPGGMSNRSNSTIVTLNSSSTPADKNVSLLYAHIEGNISIKKKGKMVFPKSKGLIYWNSPWSTVDKNKNEEAFLINGNGYMISEEEIQLFWKNNEGKDVVKKLAMGYICKLQNNAPIE